MRHKWSCFNTRKTAICIWRLKNCHGHLEYCVNLFSTKGWWHTNKTTTWREEHTSTCPNIWGLLWSVKPISNSIHSGSPNHVLNFDHFFNKNMAKWHSTEKLVPNPIKWYLHTCLTPSWKFEPKPLQYKGERGVDWPPIVMFHINNCYDFTK